MKYILIVVALFVSVCARADHDGVSAIDKGTYVDNARVTGSSIVGTAFPSNVAKLMDGMYFNNTATVIWIGSTTATIHLTDHSNITAGFPILSSATFSLGGKFPGFIYFTCNAGVSTCEVRRLEGLNR